MNNNRQAIGKMVVTVSLIVALALIAFVSPISAADVGTHNITFESKTFDGENTIWAYTVTTGCDPSLSYWSLEFCGEETDILEVSETPGEYHKDIYGNDDITGIKFDTGYECGEDGPETRDVWFKLRGDWAEGSVKVGTKAGSDELDTVATALGSVIGPICNGDNGGNDTNDDNGGNDTNDDNGGNDTNDNNGGNDNNGDNGGKPIPEFSTILLPVIALLGLVAFYRRKQKK